MACRRARFASPYIAIGLATTSLAAQTGPEKVRDLERVYDSLRFLADQIDVTRSLGADTSPHGVPLARLRSEYATARAEFGRRLPEIPGVGLDSVDRRAVDVMRRVWSRELIPDSGAARRERRPDGTCHEPATATLESIEAGMFTCYTIATQGIAVDGDTLDRLSILSLLGATDDRGRRERLFRALDRVWVTLNGHDEPASPYRRAVVLRRRSWAGGPTPMDRRAAGFGLARATVERWLVQALEAWRASLPDTLLEPWDFHHYVGAASRRLSSRIPLDSLIPLNHRFYRALGADPAQLGARYDVVPRPGKYPIAFTTFGARAVQRESAWLRAEPWVFATYRVGGLDNLSELLHETGHAVHLAAIRSRPAFHDWPDSDTFTEGIADLAALEIWEPRWQWTFLGDSASLEESLRGKYGGIILDMAWSLFEIRVHQPGAPSPNRVWSDITGRYLRIRPHPELSWWAMRGQLIRSPGYMLNYALGAFLVADLRRALERGVGSIAAGNPGWYREVSDAIFRFGLERSARRTTEDVLGRAVSAQALLDDLARIRTPERR